MVIRRCDKRENWEFSRFRIFPNSKKAVSIMVGYVILITIAIALSGIVYQQLVTYVPSDSVECVEGVSVFLQEVKYNCTTNQLDLTVKNSGRFNVAGYFILGSKTAKNLGTIDLSKYSDNNYSQLGFVLLDPLSENKNPMTPGEKIITSFDLSELIATGINISSIDVLPARYEEIEGKNKFVSCSNARIRETITCYTTPTLPGGGSGEGGLPQCSDGVDNNDRDSLNDFSNVTTMNLAFTDEFTSSESWLEQQMSGSVSSGRYVGQIDSVADPYMSNTVSTNFDESYNMVEIGYTGYGNGPTQLALYYDDNADCNTFSQTCVNIWNGILNTDGGTQVLNLTIDHANWIDNDGIIDQIRFDFEGATAVGTVYIDYIRFYNLTTTIGGDLGCTSAEDDSEIDGICDDNVDDTSDPDTLGDALDPGCANFTDISELNLNVQCDDGIDNDSPLDGLADFGADPGCANATDNNESNSVTITQCNDGLDNDFDTKWDWNGTNADAGCNSAGDNDERNSFVECDDGADNNDPEDSFADYGNSSSNDIGCTSPSDNNETNTGGSGTAESCPNYCIGLGVYTGGFCTSSAGVCGKSGFPEAGGNEWCVGGSQADTCCCTGYSGGNPPAGYFGFESDGQGWTFGNDAERNITVSYVDDDGNLGGTASARIRDDQPGSNFYKNFDFSRYSEVTIAFNYTTQGVVSGEYLRLLCDTTQVGSTLGPTSSGAWRSQSITFTNGSCPFDSSTKITFDGDPGLGSSTDLAWFDGISVTGIIN